MLWRFSFASTSTLDALLSRETPPSLEEVMDEQDVLAECKAQNNKLVAFLSRDDAVKSLLQWVVSGLDELDQQAADADEASFEYAVKLPEHHPSVQHPVTVPGPRPDSPPLEPAKLEEGGKLMEVPRVNETSRYPQIATEILTSELWSIIETVMNNRETLLKPFWDAVLPEDIGSEPRLEQSERERARDEYWSDKDEERDRRREVIRGMWVRVNGSFMAKRTAEMIRFIQTLPNIVERLVARIASPSVQDVIIRIVSSEEAGVNGVINWLASERLIPRLVALLSPLHTPTTHLIVSDLLKSIITLCAPSPFNPNGGNAMEQGTRDNRLIRELVSDSNISTMIGFMLDDVEVTDRDETDPFVVNPLPSLSSASSSLSHVCNILVELIRRNNSDFSEPHLFHTLRNRLMSIRQENEAEDEERRRMEEAMIELSQKMGIVHLGNLTTMLSERFDRLHRRLLEPRSQALTASASQPKPLTLERFRIVELYAELLHSSNMSILNRVPGTGPTYTSVGILSGGLAGLEALGEAIEGDRVGEGDEQVTQARELPVSSGSCSLAGSEVSDDELDDIEVEAPRPPSEASRHAPTVQPPSASGPLAPGDRLKQIYIQHRVLPTVVDLFLEYPNNDFMHHVVYDLLQQILNGRLGPGINRDLVVDLIKEARLIERILDAQRLNDRQKQPRLAYMGHIILIAEEIVKFLARCPPELYDAIKDSFLLSEWESFVEGSLRETKARDTRPLAGGKPMPAVTEMAKESEDSSDEEEAKFGEPLTRTTAADGFAARSGDDYWAATPRHVDSSDEDDDDADWLRPNGREATGQPADDFDDDAWGTFNSASPAEPAEAENPFGDDNFVPAANIGRSEPLTSRDWARDFDEQFSMSEPVWSDETPAIVMPSLDEEQEAPTTPTSTWSFSGEDEGEDLPPTTSPIEDDVSVLPNVPPPRASPNTSAPIPIRSPVSRPAELSLESSVTPRYGEAISPPDPALIAAATQDSPLGPGVTSDTQLTSGGMLEKEVGGEKITVPADEIVRGVEAGGEVRAEGERK